LIETSSSVVHHPSQSVTAMALSHLSLASLWLRATINKADGKPTFLSLSSNSMGP